MKLRTTEQGWMIDHPHKVTSVMKAIEALCLEIAGQWLAQHPDMPLRAVGNIAQTWSATRFRYGAGLLDEQPTDIERTAYLHAANILAYLRGDQARPEVAEDEFHAAVLWFNSYMRGAGTNGDGWQRNLARGD